VRLFFSRSQKISSTAALSACVLGFYFLFQASRFSFFKSTVVNVYDERFFRAEHPAGFVEQNSGSVRLMLFRSYLKTVDTRSQDLQTAVRVRQWVHVQQPSGASWMPHQITMIERMKGDLEDPFLILEAQRAGAPAVCRRFAYLFAGAAESVGMRARVVGFSQNHLKSASAAHTLTEIWIPELRQWALMDAMWDSMYTVNNRPSSLMDIYDAVRAGRTDSVGIVCGTRISERLDRERLTREFKHVYLTMSNAFFDDYRVCLVCDRPISFAHLTNGYSSPYPTGTKQGLVAAGGLSLLAGAVLLMLCSFVGVAERVRPQMVLSARSNVHARKTQTV